MTIYVLIDPRDGRVRYVGKTANPVKRLPGHLAEARGERHRRACWLRALLALGLEPTLEVIEEVAGNGNERERFWIALYRSEGHDLVNGTDGGEGVTMTPEMRAKIGNANRGKIRTLEAREAMSTSRRGRLRPPEAVAATAQSNAGQKRSDEFKARMRAARLGKVASEETRARLSSSAKARGARVDFTSETRAKMREASKRRWHGGK